MQRRLGFDGTLARAIPLKSASLQLKAVCAPSFTSGSAGIDRELRMKTRERDVTGAVASGTDAAQSREANRPPRADGCAVASTGWIRKLADPVDPTRVVQTGRSRSKGAEFSAFGSLASAWQLAATYTNQSAKIVSLTSAASPGASVAIVPHTVASLWNKVIRAAARTWARRVARVICMPRSTTR